MQLSQGQGRQPLSPPIGLALRQRVRAARVLQIDFRERALGYTAHLHVSTVFLRYFFYLRRYKIARLRKPCLAVSQGKHGNNPLTFMYITLTIPLGEVRTIVVHSLLVCLSRKRPADCDAEKRKADPRMLKRASSSWAGCCA